MAHFSVFTRSRGRVTASRMFAFDRQLVSLLKKFPEFVFVKVRVE